MKRFIKFLVVLFPILFYGNLEACEEPEPGMLLTKDQLLKNSEEVYLVRLSKEVAHSGKTYLLFETLETLYGKHKEKILYKWASLSTQLKYDTTTFNNHTLDIFWTSGKGRCEFPCCICAPYHTFRIGDTYLLFPKYNGSPYHCERINSRVEDKWLKYAQDYYRKQKSNE